MISSECDLHFPKFNNLSEFKGMIPRVLPKGFVEYERSIDIGGKSHDVTIYNYRFANFPPFDDPYFTVLREMRGLMFSSETGKIISRPFHKFFNLDERQETFYSNLSWDMPYRMEMKHDGSLIHASHFNGHSIYSTKMGPTTEIALMAAEFASDTHDKLLRDNPNHTFLFEYCGPKNQVVIEHPEEKLELLAIRNKIDGSYSKGIPRETITFDNPLGDDKMQSIFNIRQWTGAEGVVISWENGERIKIKTEDYLEKHQMVFLGASPKRMLQICLEDSVDDFKSSYPNHPDLNKLLEFSTKYLKYRHDESEKIERLFNNLKHLSEDRKNFALTVLNDESIKPYAQFMFNLLDSGGNTMVLQDRLTEHHWKNAQNTIEKLGH